MWRVRLNALSGVPHEWVKAQMVLNSVIVHIYLVQCIVAQASGNYTASFTSKLLNSEDRAIPDEEEEDIIKWCAGGLYVGATDTASRPQLPYGVSLSLFGIDNVGPHVFRPVDVRKSRRAEAYAG